MRNILNNCNPLPLFYVHGYALHDYVLHDYVLHANQLNSNNQHCATKIFTLRTNIIILASVTGLKINRIVVDYSLGYTVVAVGSLGSTNPADLLVMTAFNYSRHTDFTEFN